MATISKFYLLDAASSNTGMPSSNPINDDAGANPGGSQDLTAGAVKDATDVAGASQQAVVATTTANQLQQKIAFRRFASAPLAAQTLPTGNWTFSAASAESNANSNASLGCHVAIWRPSSAAFVSGYPGLMPSGGQNGPYLAEPGLTQTAASAAASFAGTAVLDGDVLIFDVFSYFSQSMSTAYTQTFYYNGTTEASTTSCASFVTPPAALTLFTPVLPVLPLPHPAFIYLRQNR